MDQNKLMQIFGTQELIKAFEEMDNTLQNKVLNTSFKEAAKLIIDQAKNNLKGSYKHVAASLSMSYQKNIQTMTVGAKRPGSNLSYIANSGTKLRSYKTKNGTIHKTGKVTGNYFFDNALNQTKEDVQNIISEQIFENFQKILQKNNTTK